jgi:hypothetical protein
MASSLSPQEKTLYHQIHPLKLATDWATGIAALYSFWEHKIIPRLLIAYVPSVLVSVILLRLADLWRQRDSAFGRYVQKYMTRFAQSARLIGYAVMAAGAWFHLVWLILVGLLVILIAWFWGQFFNA